MNYRKFLYPFSILYHGITALRNYAFDRGWRVSSSYQIPIITIGNLSVGGTGKSPMVEFLISFLKEEYQIAVLSRGYKRKTSGFLEVQSYATAAEVGDEPLQIKKKYPEVTVAVCADRRKGIELLSQKAELILLDDAFQHRKVIPALSILLTPFDDLFINDCLLPAGNLRESRKGYKRAHIIVVTKCPDRVAYAKLQEIQFKMKLKEYQSIYFSKIAYQETLQGISESLPLSYLKDKPFTLVTGIANPVPLITFLKSKQFQFHHLKFSDHHYFSTSEINQLKKEELIITTEKDFQRLAYRLEKHALYYLPIQTEFLYERAPAFKKEVTGMLEYFRKF